MNEINDYDVSATGVITTPGKFEGEPAWVALLWEMGLEGFYDAEEDGVYYFDIDAELAEEIPALANHEGGRVAIYEDSAGFVYHAIGRKS